MWTRFEVLPLVDPIEPTYNPSHPLPRLLDFPAEPTNPQAKFETASQITGEEFLSHLNYFSSAWIPARGLVESALASRFDVHPSGSVVKFSSGSPWKDHLFSIEPTLSPASEILYVLYPESDAPDSKWRIQCVPKNSDSFENRKSLPESWRGVRDDKLSEVAGIKGCIFCHASGFTGGAATYEAVLEMAQKSLDA